MILVDFQSFRETPTASNKRGVPVGVYAAWRIDDPRPFAVYLDEAGDVVVTVSPDGVVPG